MDLATENRIAAILMKEAAELRRQADKDSVHAYLRLPNARCRPNSQFLTATVLGVQQANRAVEVDEMWRIREKEKELDNMLKMSHRDQSSSDWGDKKQDVDNRKKRKLTRQDSSYRDDEAADRLKRSDESSSGRSYKDKRHADGEISSKRSNEEYSLVDERLKDDEIENFLNSKVKRGRDAVGSQMDETGPYPPPPPPHPGTNMKQFTFTDMFARKKRDHNCILGPEKPSGLVSWSLSHEESVQKKHKKPKKK